MSKNNSPEVDRENLIVHVKRFNPRSDTEPFWQTYEVPRTKVSRLLDVIEYIQKELDPSLAIRPHYCRDLVCNACYVNYDSKPRMSCMTPINDRMKEFKLEPLAGHRVVRDLVVDFLEHTDRSADG